MKKSIFTRLTEDHGSWCVNKFDNFTLSCFRIYSNFLVKIISSFRGVRLGKGCQFYGILHFHRYPFSSIEIRKNCTFRSDHTSNLIGVNHKCILSTRQKGSVIIIGNDCGFSGVSIGANAIITDNDWHLDRSNSLPKPVIIEDNVWIGVNTTILKGVTIGENSIIRANSFVLSNIPANVIASGVPCKVIKLIKK